jgi:hypothetical protein
MHHYGLVLLENKLAILTWKKHFTTKATNDCTDAGGRATQERLPRTRREIRSLLQTLDYLDCSSQGEC